MGNPPFKDIEDLKKSTDLHVQGDRRSGLPVHLHQHPERAVHQPRRAARASLRDRPRADHSRRSTSARARRSTLPVPEVIPWAYQTDGLPYGKRDVAKAKAELPGRGRDRSVVHVPDLERLAAVATGCRADQGPDQRSRHQHGHPADRVRHRCPERQHRRVPGPQPGLERRRRSGRRPLLRSSTPKAGFNFAKYSNPTFDKLLDDGRQNLEQSQAGRRLQGGAEDLLDRSADGRLLQHAADLRRPQGHPELPADLRRLLGRARTTPKSGARSRVRVFRKGLRGAAAARFSFARTVAGSLAAHPLPLVEACP